MIEIKNLTKTFHTEGGDVTALSDISLSIEDGDIYGIIGMSGAGKSTMVRCINALEKPDKGSVIIDGVDLTSLSGKKLRDIRREVTMIFQHFNLLMQRNCLRNIMFPLELAGVDKQTAKKRALELLETVGLSDKAYAFPAQLSGGQQQRIAIARALATEPKVLLCDEATSALDPTTTHSILNLIRDINERMGITVIVITHQMQVVESICKHVAILDGGKVVESGEVSSIFAHPSTDAARRLMFPEQNNEELPFAEDQRVLRVVFNGDAAAKVPLVAMMAADTGILASILYASTRSIGEAAYGTMLLGVENKDETVAGAISYICEKSGIVAEDVTYHV